MKAKLMGVLKWASLLLLLAIGAASGVWALITPAPELANGQKKSAFLDIHVHVAGIGAGGSGCYINPTMRDNFRFGIFLESMGVTLDDLEGQGDQVLIDRLASSLSDSNRVDGAVILALDGIIGPDGQLDEKRTQVYVPNEYVATQTSRFDHLHFGASINPYRVDALERLEWAAAHGAVLVKWIPAIMHIDPSDPAISEFYQRMVELDLPLLSHAGQERSFPDVQDHYSDPLKLALPLELGVTVIAAHIGTTGVYGGQSSYQRLLPMFAQYPNLYSEISSLTQINKLGYLKESLGVEGLQDRLMYGSDWPLQMLGLVHPIYQWPDLTLAQAKAIAALNNPWDRDVALKEQLGVPAAVFERSRIVLGRKP